MTSMPQALIVANGAPFSFTARASPKTTFLIVKFATYMDRDNIIIKHAC